MYDHELDAGITDFEGIFGLGLPYEDGVVSTSSWLTTVARRSMAENDGCNAGEGVAFGKLTELWKVTILNGKSHYKWI